ncbi:MAG: 30S ribosome-binding factor RbfA [Patescibacteria group bacterium]
MQFFRKERAESLIASRLSLIIMREVEFDGALVTITRVEVGKKFETAKVYVSVIPNEREHEAYKKLKAMQGKLQFILYRDMNIRPMPQIAFELDRGNENSAAVEKALLEEDNNEQAAS